jgi:hypothetical protein
MKRFWVSWKEPTPDDDYRPMTWPLPESIPAYWCSGGDIDGTYATLCAVIDAPSEDKVEPIVKSAWPNHGEFRFIEEKPANFRPGDRFPWPAKKN